jgi:hypothetical protein
MSWMNWNSGGISVCGFFNYFESGSSHTLMNSHIPCFWWQLLNKATIQQLAHKPTIRTRVKFNYVILFLASWENETSWERNMQKPTSTLTWTKVRWVEMQVMTVFVLVFRYNWSFACQDENRGLLAPSDGLEKSRTQYVFSLNRVPPHQSDG